MARWAIGLVCIGLGVVMTSTIVALWHFAFSVTPPTWLKVSTMVGLTLAFTALVAGLIRELKT